MTQKLNVTSYPYPASLSFCQWLPKLLEGVETAATCYFGAADPTTSAPEAWGARQLGTLWWDSGVDGTTLNPILKQWRLVSTGPDTYGWKRVCSLYEVKLTTKVGITFSPAGPFTADDPGGGGWNTHSLAALFDANSAHLDEHRVVEALIDFQLADDATTAGGYLELRTTGESNEVQIRLPAGAQPVHVREWVLLDASEQFDWRVFIGSGGTPSVALQANLLGWKEMQ